VLLLVNFVAQNSTCTDSGCVAASAVNYVLSCLVCQSIDAHGSHTTPLRILVPSYGWRCNKSRCTQSRLVAAYALLRPWNVCGQCRLLHLCFLKFNDAMGHLLHSFILVPHHGWRFSHLIPGVTFALTCPVSLLLLLLP
jgi:hypothetical protein